MTLRLLVLCLCRALLAAMVRATSSLNELKPVLSQDGRRSSDWFQFVPLHAQVEVSASSSFGRTCLAPQSTRARCPEGHLLGMRLLSPLHVQASSLPGTDWAASRQFLGLRQGLFRPAPLLLISQRVYRLLKQLQVRPLPVEVAHLDA